MLENPEEIEPRYYMCSNVCDRWISPTVFHHQLLTVCRRVVIMISSVPSFIYDPFNSNTETFVQNVPEIVEEQFTCYHIHGVLLVSKYLTLSRRLTLHCVIWDANMLNIFSLLIAVVWIENNQPYGVCHQNPPSRKGTIFISADTSSRFSKISEYEKLI